MVSGGIDLFDLTVEESLPNSIETEQGGVAVVEIGLHMNEASPRFDCRKFLGSQCERPVIVIPPVCMPLQMAEIALLRRLSNPWILEFQTRQL